MSDRVCAVVVTYNRKALLGECLAALRAQTRPADEVLVVDNASTDGTADLVREEHPDVELLALPDNQGGAGGFHEGMKRAYDQGFDWLWLMDDDTIASETALERLLAAAEESASPSPPYLLASKVVWMDGRLHPMNAPGIDVAKVDRLIDAVERRLIPLRATTFVSLLVSARSVRDFGLPHKHYFLWSDDIEYTARVLRRERGYTVPDSVALHKTPTAYTAVQTTDSRFYYHVRNVLFMIRGGAWDTKDKVGLGVLLVRTSASYLRYNRYRPRNALIVLRGLRDGLFQRAE